MVSACATRFVEVDDRLGQLAEGLVIEAQSFARCKSTVDMDIGMKNFVQNGPRVPAVFLHE